MAQVEKSKISWQNIDVKALTLYIKLNETKIKNKNVLKSIKRFLPIRKPKSNRGRKPTIASKNQVDKWIWPSLNISNIVLKRLMGVGLGLAVKFIFENFVYTFGGKYFLQCKGAPIGNRISMCAANLSMEEWREKFLEIIKASKIEELLAGLYVDDGRNMLEILPIGVRFCEKLRIFLYREEWEEEDKLEGMSGRQRTKLQVGRAMNAISPDLKFTLELSEEFNDGRLPTLSFSLWEEPWGISHSYYEKDVRSQVLLMERSAMSKHSKFSIMANELKRRLEVLNEKIDGAEKVKIIDRYVQQLKNSGYSRKQTWEMVVSAVRSYERKENERKDERKPKYRHGKDTFGQRARKKLTENVTWFRNNRSKTKKELNSNSGKTRWRHQNEKVTDSPQAVLFVPCTDGSVLAKDIREVIQTLKPFTKIHLKVVERAGRKLIETLHKSNPWENAICKRNDCLPCTSSRKDQKEAVKSCKRRSIVYKTWCHTCKVKTRQEIEEKYAEKKKEDKNDKKRKRNEKATEKESEKDLQKKIERELEERTYKYIGETSRSCYERATEHLRDLRDMEPGIHLLNHIIQKHMETPNDVEFRMKILSSHFTAFNRQITEAVRINRNKGPYLLNSKSEYNRSSLPSIKTSERKSEWELADIDELEVKEAINILKKRGNKLECMIQLVKEKENEKEKVQLIEEEKEREEVEVLYENEELGENPLDCERRNFRTKLQKETL